MARLHNKRECTYQLHACLMTNIRKISWKNTWDTLVLIRQPVVIPAADAMCSRRQAVWKLLKPWTRIALIMYLSSMCVIRTCSPAHCGKLNGCTDCLGLLYLKLLPWLHNLTWNIYNNIYCSWHMLFKYNMSPKAWGSDTYTAKSINWIFQHELHV